MPGLSTDDRSVCTRLRVALYAPLVQVCVPERSEGQEPFGLRGSRPRSSSARTRGASEASAASASVSEQCCEHEIVARTATSRCVDQVARDHLKDDLAARRVVGSRRSLPARLAPAQGHDPLGQVASSRAGRGRADACPPSTQGHSRPHQLPGGRRRARVGRRRRESSSLPRGAAAGLPDTTLRATRGHIARRAVAVGGTPASPACIGWGSSRASSEVVLDPRRRPVKAAPGLDRGCGDGVRRGG